MPVKVSRNSKENRTVIIFTRERPRSRRVLSGNLNRHEIPVHCMRFRARRRPQNRVDITLGLFSTRAHTIVEAST